MKNMDAKTLVYIVVAWLALNVIVPLFVNSIERMYKKRIDSFVQSSMSLFRRFFFFLVKILLTVVLTILQILFIIIMLPTILWVPVAERFFPKIFTLEILSVRAFEDQRHVAKLVLKLNFWEIVFNQMRLRRDEDSEAAP